MSGPPLRYPISALFSYFYFPDVALIRGWHNGGLRLVADSGAFSAYSLGRTIDVAEFAAWAHEVRPYVSWIASVDVIGDEDRTWATWQELRTQGVDAVPTVHYGCAPTAVDRYVAEGVDFVGLGGMVGRKSEPERQLRWALSVMRYAATVHPQLRFHGWGVTHARLMDLPWYSIDSSGFGSGYRYARLNLFDPDLRRFVTADLPCAHKHAALLRKHYNTDPASISYSTPANRTIHVAVAARSAQLMEDYLRARHNVQPPTYGVGDIDVVGTSVHVAESSMPNLWHMTTGGYIK